MSCVSIIQYSVTVDYRDLPSPRVTGVLNNRRIGSLRVQGVDVLPGLFFSWTGCLKNVL